MRYVIWNNKGGVGKTFISYSIASEYAFQNPGKTVAILDLCPQSNISEMCLGGHERGQEALDNLYSQNRTVANYIKCMYNPRRFGMPRDDYFVRAIDYNDNMPSNLYLLPGDGDLDVSSLLINHMESGPETDSWIRSRTLLYELVDKFESQHTETVMFIDCNPSFANYTQLGIKIADKIIVPCTADSASIRGIITLFRLIYGISINDTMQDEIFNTFNKKIREAGHTLPQVHNYIINKARTRDSRITKGYESNVKKIREVVSEIHTSNPELFDYMQGSKNDILDLKDGNNLALVVNICGIPPSKLSHRKYEIFGDETQVNQSQIEPFLEDLRAIVGTL